MVRLCFILGLLMLHPSIGISQDSTKNYLQRQKSNIDSIIKVTDADRKPQTKQLYGASVRGGYTGLSYVQIKPTELRKLNIQFTSGETEIIYTVNEKILKVVRATDEYYSINNFYYNKQLDLISSPPLLASLVDCESILAMIVKIVIPQK